MGLLLLVCLRGRAVAVAPPWTAAHSADSWRTVWSARCAAGAGTGQAALARPTGRRRGTRARARPRARVRAGRAPAARRPPPLPRLGCSEPPTTATSTPTAPPPGERATVFTHVVRRGGGTYIQYWLYYPDSNTAWAGSDGIWHRSPCSRWAAGRRVETALSRLPPGRREGAQSPHRPRRARMGARHARTATTRAGGRGLPQPLGAARAGWTRVSRGSHAGHIPVRLRWPRRRRPDRVRPAPSPGFQPLLPGSGLHERTSSAEALRLVPLESRPARRPTARRTRRSRRPGGRRCTCDPESGES